MSRIETISNDKLGGETSGVSKLTEEAVIAIRLDPRRFLDIANDYGITPGEVGHVKRRRIWDHVPGETIYGNKYKELTDKEILAIFTDKRLNTEIAKDYGIGKNRVWYIKHGITYSNITGGGA